MNSFHVQLNCSEELQKAATDADAVRALASLLMQPSTGARVREGVLRALGSLCMSRQDVRQQMVDPKVRLVCGCI